MRRHLASLAMLLLLTGAQAPKASREPPAYSANYEPRSVDERGMWSTADEYERGLRDSSLVVRDEALSGYVRRVLCQTVGDDRCRALRIYIVEDPRFNASMLPNGTMQVHTGLLLRARSEAELGAVLGHEFAHFELRHSLEGFKAARGASDALAWVQVLGGISGQSTRDTAFTLVASFFQFKRAQETSADVLGLAYLAKSPYPARAASEVWQHLMAEQDATASGRKLKTGNRYTTGYLDSHPTDLDRAVYLLQMAATLGDDGDPGVEGHRAAITPHIHRLLNAQVRMNDFGGSEYMLRELAARGGWTGDLLFARGELYRQRANPRDLVTAAQFFGDAIKAGYAEPEVHRNLGLSLLRSGEVTPGRAALSKYLSLKPEAGDAKAIASLLKD